MGFSLIHWWTSNCIIRCTTLIKINPKCLQWPWHIELTDLLSCSLFSQKSYSAISWQGHSHSSVAVFRHAGVPESSWKAGSRKWKLKLVHCLFCSTGLSLHIIILDFSPLFKFWCRVFLHFLVSGSICH